VLGGNRSGKTTCGCVEFLWHLTNTYPDWYPEGKRYKRSVKGRIFCEDFQKAGMRVIVPALEEWLDMSFVSKKVRNPMGFPIYWELKNGSSFEILTYEQKTDQYEGWKGDMAWFDEPPPRDKYIATIRGLIDSNGRAWLTLTPLKQPWLYDELFANADGANVFAVTMDIRDNLIREEDGIHYGHLTEEAIRKFENSLKPEEREARIHGRFLHLTGLVYKQFDSNLHLVDSIKPRKEWTRYMAIDPHPRTPTHCLWIAIDPEDNLWVYDELVLGNMDIQQMSNAIRAQEGPYPAHIRYIDPAMDNDNTLEGGFNARKEFMKHGIYTIRANNDWPYGKNAVETALQPVWNHFLGKEVPRLRISKNGCPRLVYELLHYVWDDYKHQGEDKTPKQKPMKKDDHLLDCLRYILAGNPVFVSDEEEEVSVVYKGTYTKYPAQVEGGSRDYRSLTEHGSD